MADAESPRPRTAGWPVAVATGGLLFRGRGVNGRLRPELPIWTRALRITYFLFS